MMIIPAGQPNAGKYYYHFDGLGSVVAISNVNKQIMEKYSYDVFGQTTIKDANNTVLTTSYYKNPYMFTGREYDSNSGLYYYRARYYKPSIGRFLQTDPVGYYGSGLNLYTYCLNNPINWVDPYGQFKWRQLIKGFGQISLGLIDVGLVLAVGAPTGGLGAAAAGGLVVGGSLALASGAMDILGAFTPDTPIMPTSMGGYIDMGLGGSGEAGDFIYDIITVDVGGFSLDSLDITIDVYIEIDTGGSGDAGGCPETDKE